MPSQDVPSGAVSSAPSGADAAAPPRASRLGFFVAQGAVIVVSVLFALAVDRIVKGMDEAALERTYLESLREDFEATQATAADARARALMRDTASVTVLATIRGNPPDSNGLELARDLELAGWVIEIQPPRDTWDDMVSTGRLGIIENTDLRTEIATFYRKADELHVFSRDWVEMVRGYGDLVRTILEPELRVAIGSEFTYLDSIPKRLEPNLAELARRIAATPGLREEIGDVLLINKVSALLYEDMGARAARIHAMIGEELGIP